MDTSHFNIPREAPVRKLNEKIAVPTEHLSSTESDNR